MHKENVCRSLFGLIGRTAPRLLSTTRSRQVSTVAKCLPLVSLNVSTGRPDWINQSEVNRCLRLGHWIGGYDDGVRDCLFLTHEFFLYYAQLILFGRIECSSGKNTRSD
jgi:hypothetical protein